MIQAIIPGEPVEYILKDDRKSQNPTVWTLKNLSMSEEAYVGELAGAFTKKDRSLLAIIEAQQKILSIGLISAKPFKDKSGKDAVFTRDMTGPAFFKDYHLWTEESLDQIGRAHRDELAAAIINGGKLTDDAQKN